MPRPLPRRERGFTLIEAVICMLVASILLGLAVSATSSALARADASAARSALLASLTKSINHAAITGTEVVLCPGDRDGCRDTYDWSGGWVAYADIDGDRERDAVDTVVDIAPPLSDRVRLLSTTGRRRLVFQPNGGNAGSNVTFTLCETGSTDGAEALVLANDGRLRATRPRATAIRSCIQAR